MTRLILSACTVALGATLTMSAWCAAENVTTINILSPRDGDTVPETFEITYEILNAPGGIMLTSIWMAPIRRVQGHLHTGAQRRPYHYGQNRRS